MPKDKSNSSHEYAELRKRAEKWINPNTLVSPSLSLAETRRLIHDLHTYQIELELQNDDLRQAQTELEESRRRFLELYDFAPVAYLTINDKDLITEANLTAGELLGIDRGQLLNRTLTTYIAAADQPIYYYTRKKLLETGTSQSALRIKKKDGAVIPALLKGAISPAVDGKSGQFRLTLTDISERQKLEENLRRSKNEWVKTFDAMSDMVTIQDPDMRIIRANKAAHDNFQVPAGGLDGRYCHEVFLGSNQPCPNCPLPKTLKEKNTNSAEIVNAKNGRVLEITTIPMLNENGEIYRIVHIAKDITEQKKVETELLQAHKMEAIGTLAGGIAHDFNNMLQAILGYADLARDELSKDSNAGNYLEEIIRAGKRAKEVIKQILTFSREDQEERQPVRPAAIINEALKLVRALLPATIEIEAEIAPDDGTIMINPTNLHHILINLSTNAMQAMKAEKGVLTVGLKRVALSEDEIVKEDGVRAGDYMELTVSDSGRGMDEKAMERIFEPYFTTRDVGKGSGMGLAMVHGIVRGCGGFIRVKSMPGQGSSFRLYFPVLAGETAAGVAEEEQAPIPTGRERILVVDDEESLVEMYQAILEQLGYAVTVHSSSEQALAAFQASPENFDLVITDQAMPKLSGSELATRLLAIRPTIPILLCTGYSSIISEENAAALGIAKYIAKPIRMKELAETIRETLDRGKSHPD
jgi:PAS domain S-box-containing protein